MHRKGRDAMGNTNSLAPEQRADQNGKLVTRWIRGDGTPVTGRTFPPAILGGDGVLLRALELSVTKPEQVNWKLLTPEQITEIAKNANGHIDDMEEPGKIYDFYSCMIDGGVEPEMVSGIVQKERVAERARTAWVTLNGEEEAPLCKPELWVAKREKYRASYSKFISKTEA